MTYWKKKPLRHPYDDALSRVTWQDFERLVAESYRQQGYTVDHCGTGAGVSRFDGGIDIKLYRHGICTVVQCKHSNQEQVSHNPVHQLYGVMHSQRASHAIVVISGEFTDAAIEAAGKLSEMQLLDGAATRAMLGPVAEPQHRQIDGRSRPRAASVAPIPSQIPTNSAPAASSRATPPRPHRGFSALPRLVAGVAVLALLYIGIDHFRGVSRGAPDVALSAPVPPTKAVPTKQSAKPVVHRVTQRQLPVTQPRSSPSPKIEETVYRSGNMSEAEFDEWKRRVAMTSAESPASSSTVPVYRSGPMTDSEFEEWRRRNALPGRTLPATTAVPIYRSRSMTDAELREWNRRNAEAMNVLDKTTPEIRDAR
jgi:hypothetical protein